MRRRPATPRTFLLLVTLAMMAGALLPLKWTGWAGWFHGPLMTAIAPVSAPLSLLADWLRPGDGRRGVDDASVEQLMQERDAFKSEYLQSQDQITQLREVIRQLQNNVEYGSPLRLKRLEATRIATDLGAGTIQVSRGSVHGVTKGSIAVAAGAQLVGIVTNVGPTVSTVHVITDRRLAPNLVEALVLPAGSVNAESLARAPRAQFRPTGDGAMPLVGEIGADDAAQIQPGDVAYLADDGWPPAARMLSLGRVVRIEETERPLFRRVIVRPDVEPLRVRGVVLRIPLADGEAPTDVGGVP